MKKFAALVLALGMGLAAGLAFAQTEDEPTFPGVAVSHKNIEKFDMTTGITGTRRPALPTRLWTWREQLNVPDYYGQLFNLTGDATKAILWYADRDGVVRNVIVEDPGTRLYAIVATPVANLSVEAVPFGR